MPQPAYPNTVTLNGVNYRLADPKIAGGAPLIWSSHGKDLFKLNRPDIVPGDLPGEYWWLYRGGGAGIGPTYYRAPSHVRTGNSSTKQTSGVDCAFPGLMTLGGARIFNKSHTNNTSVDQGGFAEENSQLLYISRIKAWLVGAGNLTQDVDFSATDANATMFPPIMHRGDVYVGSGSNATTGRIFKRAAGVWTSTVLPTELLVVGPQRLYRSYQDSSSFYLIQNCALDADPTVVANWGGTINVGPNTDPINGLSFDGADLVVTKASGVYTVDVDGNIFNWTQELQFNTINGKGTTNCLGFILVPTINGLVAYRQGRVYYNCGPESQTDETSQIGFCQALTARAGWIYAIFQGASNQRLMKARLRNPADPPGGPFVWFPWTHNAFNDTTLGGTIRMGAFISDLLIDSRDELMLWLGSEKNVVSFFLLRSNEGVYDYGTSEAITVLPASGTFLIPDDDFGFPGAIKLFTHVYVIGRNIASANNCQFIATVDGAGTGTIAINSSGSLTTFGTQGISGRLMTDIQFILNRHASTYSSTPAVELLAIRFFVRPDEERTVQLKLLAAEQLSSSSGRIMSGTTGEGTVSNVLALSEQTSSPIVTFRDETDTSYSVLILPPIRAERITIPGEESPYYLVSISGVVL